MFLAGNSIAAQTFREKKQEQSRVFFDVNFDVYTHVEKEKERKTEKELERVIKKKESNVVGRKT